MERYTYSPALTAVSVSGGSRRTRVTVAATCLGFMSTVIFQVGVTAGTASRSRTPLLTRALKQILD